MRLNTALLKREEDRHTKCLHKAQSMMNEVRNINNRRLQESKDQSKIFPLHIRKHSHFFSLSVSIHSWSLEREKRFFSSLVTSGGFTECLHCKGFFWLLLSFIDDFSCDNSDHVLLMSVNWHLQGCYRVSECCTIINFTASFPELKIEWDVWI